MHGLVGLIIGGALKQELSIVLNYFDIRVNLLEQRAFRAFDNNHVVFIDRYRHAGRNRNRKFSDTRHTSTSNASVGYQI